jgi:hypothetical protein
MELSTVLLTVAVLSVIWGVADAILLAVWLDKRGYPINMLLFRVLIIRYLNQYRDETLKETGKVGPLFYSYIVAMNLALVCAVVGLILRAR